MKFKSEMERKSLESKRNIVKGVENKFNQVIKKKIGDLLIEEISRFLGNGSFNSEHLKILNIPRFFKPIFKFFNNNQLLLESSLLYIIYSLDIMNPEMQEIYDGNLSRIEYKRNELMEIKDLLWIDVDTTEEFVCQFNLPSFILPIYPVLEKEFQNLLIFGLLKIFEWLNLLNTKVSSLIPKYEQNFAEILQTIL
ncbi:MAG: hypothetical protein HWN66_13740 [Candidatus Helarchaeota archaeon]|nr:hypothetical protein [Candidatus Helarchaeota archaeon]